MLVEVHEGARVGAEHMQVTTYKIAPGGTAGQVGVVRRTGTGPDDVEMRLNSNDATPRTDILLKTSASFDPGTDVLDPAGKNTAKGFAGWWAGGGAPICATCSKEITELASSPINLHVQGSGPEPEKQANARFTNVVSDLLAGGMGDAVARCRFHYDGTGDQVRLVVGNGEPQIVAAHEAGHMFGFDDEYQKSNAPKGTPGDPLAIGAPVDPGLAQAQGLPGAVREHSDSIMSVGSAVKPQHYATFLAALKLVTGMDDWAFGPAPGAIPPGVDGPVPRPGQKGPHGAQDRDCLTCSSSSGSMRRRASAGAGECSVTVRWRSIRGRPRPSSTACGASARRNRAGVRSPRSHPRRSRNCAGSSATAVPWSSRPRSSRPGR